MELRIRQRVFAMTDTYDVFDENGEARYYVREEFFSFGHQIHVYDKRTDSEVGGIFQRLFSLRPRFDIEVNGQTVGTITKKLTMFRPRYKVDYRGWEVEGNIFQWDYTVREHGREIMSISKELLTWGDTYILHYDDASHEILGLLLVIAIDAANCERHD